MFEPSVVPWLLLSVAVAFTCLGAVLGRRYPRRPRRSFAIGLACGVLAGPVLQRRSRGIRAARGAARGADRLVARVLGTARRGSRQPSRR